MNLSKVKRVSRGVIKQTYDITVGNNHNFFCNNVLIHNCDYRGHIVVLLYNLGAKKVELKRGERVAQMVINKLPDVELVIGTVDTDTTRGEAGFGSTDLQIAK